MPLCVLKIPWIYVFPNVKGLQMKFPSSQTGFPLHEILIPSLSLNPSSTMSACHQPLLPHLCQPFISARPVGWSFFCATFPSPFHNSPSCPPSLLEGEPPAQVPPITSLTSPFPPPPPLLNRTLSCSVSYSLGPLRVFPLSGYKRGKATSAFFFMCSFTIPLLFLFFLISPSSP